MNEKREHIFMKQIKLKKVLIIAAIVLAVLLVGGVVVGALNALVADGAWSFGWSDYRYDDSGYEIGEGSIPFTEITHIEIDWVDGAVEIVPCQDTYPSISEDSDEALPESAEVRWRVSEDGKTLSIKYRKSSWFFSVGSGSRNKRLTLRIPERLLEQMVGIDVEVISSAVTVRGISAQRLEVSTESGNVTLDACTFAEADVETENGDVVLRMPTDAAFVLNWETERGKLSSDFSFVQEGTRYTVGNGGATVSVETERGDLLLARKES